MAFGTPIDLGRCARKVIYNISMNGVVSTPPLSAADTATAEKTMTPTLGRRRRRRLSVSTDSTSTLTTRTTNSTNTKKKEKKPKKILLFIASDNHGSAMQMNDTVQWVDSIVSPHGCHVEMDTSIECSELTLGNW